MSPSSEWIPQYRGWMVARVAEGTGYWMHGGNVRELNVGDGFIVGYNVATLLRSSQLGPLKLQFFTVQPQYLNGLLTAAEWHQLEVAPNNPLSHVLIFSASEPTGQKFARLAEHLHNHGLSARCALLQLWVNAVAGLVAAPVSESVSGNSKLRERFRQLVGKMTEAELAEFSLSDLARQLHCSERHLSRLFHEEFGVPLRARQIELRLQRACRLLAISDAKILNIAYDSGYRHLGLFNAMFKKRFGVTPSEWRQQNKSKNLSAQTRNYFLKVTSGVNVLLLMLCFFFSPAAFAQTNSTVSDAENASPRFTVEKYLVMGNSLLSPDTIGEIFTNVPGAFGTNVTFGDIRTVLSDLQMAYRERGFVTVSVGLPQQKLTNAMVKVQVTEGRLAAITIKGNRYFSTDNVLRALPSLRTNILLNSKVFQRELDTANASRDRQIYPVIGPGPEPGTSELTLNVKDRFPLHARLEVNNQATPNTPDLRNSFSAQYDNLWDLEHQIGVQYTYSFEQYKTHDDYVSSPLDEPLIANYSFYYRLPLGGHESVQEQVNANPGSFGYSEVTHRFNLPPATGRPELTFYASRAVSDTGVQHGPVGFATPPAAFTNNGVVYIPLSFTTNSAGENITLNEDVGFKLALPFQMGKIAATLSLGADFKHYGQTSYNTNENFFRLQYTDPQGQLKVISFAAPQALPTSYASLDYLPFNIGLNGSMPDKLGTTFFNAQLNFNVLSGFSKDEDFARISYATTNAHANFVTLQLGVDRVQTIYQDWSVKLHADGQWADGALIGNEQFAMGGTAGVRGYTDGSNYGDTGWRVSIEPQTPLINIGMVGNEGSEEPCWIRGSIFMDYGELHRFYDTPGLPGNLSSLHTLNFWGTGFGLTANIGSHLDARLTIAWPLFEPAAGVALGPVDVYFGVGAQF